MQNRWKSKEAKAIGDDPLALRVYTSRLLGAEPDLVLHGGGNTSVKSTATNLFGDEEDIIYVKGSGWDLATIKAAGFAPVKIDALRRMAEMKDLSDAMMVKAQRAAMTEPEAPSPSVEAILHAIIPCTYVDHTHADAVVTISNSPDGERHIRDLYGDRVLVIPYVMPGFILSKKVHEMTRNADWKNLEGMILMHHGIFTFSDDARESYEQMINLVSEAEVYLERHGAIIDIDTADATINLAKLAELRCAISKARGAPVIAVLNDDAKAMSFSNREDVDAIATRGPLTPDHVIRTKRLPLVMNGNLDESIAAYIGAYQSYFQDHKTGTLTCLDPAPRWAVWPGAGTVALGATVKEAGIIADISEHTVKAIQQAEVLGGWQALPAKDVFDVEYWELEQAKLRKGGSAPVFQGNVALVTGAASGIGRACVEALSSQGAAVAALDISPDVDSLRSASVESIICDVTKDEDVAKAVDHVVRTFGGLDIVLSNAGNFPADKRIDEMDADTWDKSISLNLSSHQRLLTSCIPYLKWGIDPAVVIIASKNVPAPGPGASAYSVAKAGLTQLARVAALELGEHGIRVNVLHPNAVFDTAIWTDAVLKERAAHYGLSVEDYKSKNVLRVEITSSDVACLACTMAGRAFGKTTGAQVAIDGGNERVI